MDLYPNRGQRHSYANEPELEVHLEEGGGGEGATHLCFDEELREKMLELGSLSLQSRESTSTDDGRTAENPPIKNILPYRGYHAEEKSQDPPYYSEESEDEDDSFRNIRNDVVYIQDEDTGVDCSDHEANDPVHSSQYSIESRDHDMVMMRSLGCDSSAWSEDDSSDPYESVLQNSSNDQIRESILAIRKQASQMDTMMALDQLETLQQELVATKRALLNQSEEMKELRALLHLKEGRLATLELERDLYKADAYKMQKDLQKCVVNIKRIDVTSLAVEAPQKAGARGQEETKESEAFSRNSNNLILMPTKRLAAKIPSNSAAVVVPKTPTSTDFSVRSELTTQLTDSSSTMAAPQTLHQQNRSRTPETRDGGLGVGKKYCSWPKHRGFRRLRGSSISNVTANTSPQARPPKEQKKVFEERDVVFSSSSLPLTCCRTTDSDGSLQAYVEGLQQKLKLALNTSDQLRKRLAMVSQYYEALLRRVQGKMMTMRTDRERLQADLVRQISAIEYAKRAALAKVEAALSEKNEELRRLRYL